MSERLDTITYNQPFT